MKHPGVFERKSIPIFWPSGVYGIGKCLHKTINWPEFFPIPVYCDHGFKGNMFEKHERENESFHYLTWSKERAIRNKNKYDQEVLYIKSPQVLYKEINQIHLKKNVSGTLIFLPHECGEMTFTYNVKPFDWLKDLLLKVNPPDPIVLCFHPFDIDNGFHYPFLNAGYKIVTSGNAQSPKFLEIFYQIISNFKYSFSRTVGTELFLCHEHGINHSLFGELPKNEYRTSGIYVEDTEDSEFIKKEELLRTLFYYPKSENYSKQRDEIVKNHLGLDSELGVEELKKIFFKDFILLLPLIIKKYISFGLKKLKLF